MLHTALIVIHLLLAMGVIGLVLIQHGKGADAGAAFGSGASATVFGARGSSNFLSRATGVLAALFFATSIALASLAMNTGEKAGLMDAVEQPAPLVESDLPVVDVPAPQATSDVPAAPAN